MVSIFATKELKFLGFAFGKGKEGVFIRIHQKALKKFKAKLKYLSAKKQVQSLRPALEKIKVTARGWLNYYKLASMKKQIEALNQWLYHRLRMCIWRQWKRVRTKLRNLVKLGVSSKYAFMAANSRRGAWFTSNTTAVKIAITKERLIRMGHFDLSLAYQSVHVK